MPPTSRPPRPPPHRSARGALAIVALVALATAVITAVVSATTGSRPATADGIHFIEYTTTAPAAHVGHTLVDVTGWWLP